VEGAGRVSAIRVAEATPGERRHVDAFFDAQGEELPPGRSFVAWRNGAVTAACRAAPADQGDGYHREHVRTLHLAGETASLQAVASCAAEMLPDDVRLEAWLSSRQEAHVAALERAGLRIEVTLPGALQDGAADLACLGRPPAARRSAAEPALAEARRGARSRDEVTVVWHDAATRAGLARFLAQLVPGRAYPAGTLLSEADRLETARRGALDAAWVLALDAVGEVAGGVVFERPRGRPHVRRVHLDVLRWWQARGVATRLLRAAIAGARAKLGVSRLEADPRAANAGACRAIERAGFALAGTQIGAWRLRVGGRCVDENVRFYSVATR